MLKISGHEIAQKIIDRLKSEPKPKKILATILVGENPNSITFLKQKEKTAKELGVDFRIYRLSQDLKNDDLRREVSRIANQKPVGGVIIQLPLPENINSHYVLNAIPREKDVDVLGERALGAFYAGRNPVLPPAVGVVEEILKATSDKRQATRAAVVGLGFLIGKPIATWLMAKCPEIYLLDEGSNLSILKQADLIISGVGKANLFSAKDLKENATVIDFGYDMSNGKISGDFNASSSMLHAAGWYTPTPAGTGPILVAKIFENFYKLN
jgi:methylenetetrahydrofolate dehydrogenase (NADP+)/methenyltetrahydrofolate cyclohydrolase